MMEITQKSSIYEGRINGASIDGYFGKAMAAEIQGKLCTVLIIRFDGKAAFDLPHECITEQ